MLFSPLRIRGVELPNRVVVPPMAQYSAIDGMPVPFHLIHYGKFALGGAGCVFVEATAVTRQGRITNGCLGLWSEAHAQALAPIAAALSAGGAVPAIQIAHGGRKSSMQRPWHGNGPLTEADIARGDERWEPIAASAEALDEGWLVPREMNADDMAGTAQAFADAAARALRAGFRIVEVHMAHGYLLHSFLSPMSNHRRDAYGGSLAGRMKFPLEVVDAVRDAIGPEVPLFVRISAVDGYEGGWSMDDSVAFARALKAHGVDVVDCSSGGHSSRGATNANLKRAPGYQVPFAERIRREAGMLTEAVGLIRDGELAESILQQGRADLVAVGRQFLYDPFWALHQAHAAGLDPDFERWPLPYAWWLEKWDKGLKARAEDVPKLAG